MKNGLQVGESGIDLIDSVNERFVINYWLNDENELRNRLCDDACLTNRPRPMSNILTGFPTVRHIITIQSFAKYINY